MRLAVCTLSAVLLSGCSGFGNGTSGHSKSVFAQNSYGLGRGSQVGASSSGVTGRRLRGAQGVYGQGRGSWVGASSSGVTGGQLRGAQGVYGQGGGSQVVASSSRVGASSSGVTRGLRGGLVAHPFGFEFGIGTDIDINGDIMGAQGVRNIVPPTGTNQLRVAPSKAISYGDAYKKAISYDMTATFDVNPSTTLLGRVSYSKAKGQRLKTSTIDTVVPSKIEDLYVQWSDLEQVTFEGGFRKYVGGWSNSASKVRPYVGATAGMTNNNAIDITQESASLLPAGTRTQQYSAAGWKSTASGVIGAEMRVGPLAVIGVEAGIRWRSALDTTFKSGSRLSVPLKLRGRVSF